MKTRPLVKKQRGTSVGSIATNLHEGSRSEYLAQYVFSSFGTAVPVPHQEDTGLDIYCTLLERDGLRAWPRGYYSLQVKSTMELWIFASPESVRWFIEHPLPIFLCIVHKAEARILIYHTTPRFAAWILPLHKNRLELIPGTETKARPVETSWEEGSSFELKAPILNFTIQEALDDTYRARLTAVLKLWIDNDMDNIFRIQMWKPSISSAVRIRNELCRRYTRKKRVWRPIFATVRAASKSGAQRATRAYYDASL